jgi:AGCS family alanine or glycine:cation symporter
VEAFTNALNAINGVIWADWVLYTVLGVGVLFTLWSGFCQYRALTHGIAVTRGKYDDPDDPGAISHFQALSAALSATVGLGNIGGVAVAIALGGPGAVFWMWMIGLAGMALKTTEVALAMMYRVHDDDGTPHGGPMYVAKKAFADWGLAGVGKVVGGLFCITLLISAVTGGNMFQAWNVAGVTNQYFGVDHVITGIVLAVVVAAVILGGIKRIGSVAGMLVPFMCGTYLIAAIYVVVANAGQLPEVFGLIIDGAFNTLDAQGAFIGGTAGYAFLWGMKRALFSSEAGQGSSPIAHAAAKSKEPIRESVVAGLEPFIDTIVVCTLTALVILTTGTWNRGVEIELPPNTQVTVAQVELTDAEKKDGVQGYTIAPVEVAAKDGYAEGTKLFVVVEGAANANAGNSRQKIGGTLKKGPAGKWTIEFGTVKLAAKGGITLVEKGGYFEYGGATLTAKAFDNTVDGLGKWLVSIAAWLFAISTMISWSYYGEQGIVFLFGGLAVLPYRLIYCGLAVVACVPSLIKTDAELDALTALGTGVMLWVNIPIMLIFGGLAMKAFHGYFRRLKSGEFDRNRS